MRPSLATTTKGSATLSPPLNTTRARAKQWTLLGEFVGGSEAVGRGEGALAGGGIAGLEGGTLRRGVAGQRRRGVEDRTHVEILAAAHADQEGTPDLERAGGKGAKEGRHGSMAGDGDDGRKGRFVGKSVITRLTPNRCAVREMTCGV